MSPLKRYWEYSQKHDAWPVEYEIYPVTVGVENQRPCSTCGSAKSRQNAKAKSPLERLKNRASTISLKTTEYSIASSFYS